MALVISEIECLFYLNQGGVQMGNTMAVYNEVTK